MDQVHRARGCLGSGALGLGLAHAACHAGGDNGQGHARKAGEVLRFHVLLLKGKSVGTGWPH